MPDLDLRPYREADLSSLHALDQACFPPGIVFSRTELRGFLEHPSSFSIIVCEAEQILGFAVARTVRRGVPGNPRHSRQILHLLTIDVAPEFRRRGIGKLLMRWVIAKGEELGADSLLLEVAVDNEAARSFYAAFGFEVVGTIPGYYDSKTDAHEMTLILPRGATPL